MKIDRKTGLLPSFKTNKSDIILEVFKIGNEPKYSSSEMQDSTIKKEQKDKLIDKFIPNNNVPKPIFEGGDIY